MRFRISLRLRVCLYGEVRFSNLGLGGVFTNSTVHSVSGDQKTCQIDVLGRFSEA